jgi:hypothetical protein
MSVRAALALAAVVVTGVACGSAQVDHPAPWAAAHPDPPGMHFTDASGLCAFAVQYPNDAPGDIDWKGQQFIQRSRSSGRSAAGPVVGTSADWTIHQPTAGALVLVTSSASYQYRTAAKCGSNSAPPT